MEQTSQEEIWKSKFGEDYTLRNDYDNKGLDEVYEKYLNISRTAMNQEFIGNLDREMRILEVGCNIGVQLINLQEMGFTDLFGIELQPHAVELSKQKTKGVNIIRANAYDIPFKDGYFDLVFTNRVLIHMNSDKIKFALKEIVRCTNNYIYGSEYYADEFTEVKNYRGKDNVLFKRNFPKLYSELFPELKLVKEKKYKCTFNDDVDITFLFQKNK
ncbi:MAG: methyltransferase domain-containing protein [Ignavibacteria bacterium]|nr:methyltransferase domain-containing protein [Ignavibacteria bacterium]